MHQSSGQDGGIGRAEMGCQGEQTCSKAADTPGEMGLAEGKQKTQNLELKILWGLRRWEKFPVSQESSLESGARGSIIPSLAPPPQTAPQCSKEGCPALANT